MIQQHANLWTVFNHFHQSFICCTAQIVLITIRSKMQKMSTLSSPVHISLLINQYQRSKHSSTLYGDGLFIANFLMAQ